MGKNMLFVYNPRAGKAQIRSNLLDIIDIFVKADYEVTAYPTQKPGDAIKAVKNRREGYDIVVCSGGDGTLDEVVRGMMRCEEKLPIGYVPAGSTNDFANSLKIPRSMIKAADVVVNGKLFKCDVGAFNDDSFIYVAAFGIFTDVAYETKQDLKNVLGHTAYLLEGMKRLSSIKSYHMKITCDDMELDEEYIYGMITNSNSVAGFKGITGKDVELNDGMFEVTLIRKPAILKDMNDIMAALTDKRIESDAIKVFKASKIIIESEQEVAWTLDGEYGGSHNKVVVENKKEALEIKVPFEILK
ncbi:MAG: YegS/Rv2252/BmrU family lipid kinase [Lachnospiraceae bacterium]|nr:YegS/Rv2252/BmrU family lipid kinase [Lachnospiraceae bacterium]